jgi:hypothetical protein
MNLGHVPEVLEKSRHQVQPRDLLGARAVLLDECERIMAAAEKESRALTAEERGAFDGHRDQIQEINGILAEYKRLRVADVVAAGFPPEHCRLPF